MKKTTINKTVITYKKIKKIREDLDKLGQDGWLIACSEDDGWILYKKVIQKIEKVLTKHEDAFEKFWALYPRKISKAKCEAKFMKLKESEIEPLFAGLDQYLLSWGPDIKK